ncbi:unnamed protein product [Mesocestoides corti]|uniref:Exostosin GT47 domain-containing protein n=1 Tax=Mesocestoides corti TaxID=53468 RepID=A0A158QTI3_MESCO|nr:unnamed protein product [Mesocestoides corti]
MKHYFRPFALIVSTKTRTVIFASLLLSFAPFILLFGKISSHLKPKISNSLLCDESTAPINKFNSHCTMDICFDSARCTSFKVYVYPDDPDAPRASANYRKILTAIRESPFYTPNPEEACLFVPSLDTLDRDPRSPRFIHNLQSRLNNLPFWSIQPRYAKQAKDNSTQKPHPGQNHLLFVLFPGSWPSYDVDDLRMDVGSAMLARASASRVRMRLGFDISFPLVTTNYPEWDQSPRFRPTQNGYIRLSLLTSFKGKRYVVGIGSETRNALFHIHNGKDIIMATTCKHMHNWNLYADARCATDNAYYETVSYENLLHNSTFCLVPRGRRLGSYRFLEVLEAGCIPVLLANDWELPFSEVIDWSQAAILADERTLSRLPELLRNFPDSRIVRMREQVRFIWDSYFRSIEAIVQVTLMSIRDRLTLRQKNYGVWNRRPGGVVFSETVTINDCEYPSPNLPPKCQDEINKGFTLIVTIRPPFCKDYLVRLKTLASVFTQSDDLKKAILVWQCSDTLPSSEKLSMRVFGSLPVSVSFAPLPPDMAPLDFVPPSPSNRFRPSHKDIPTIAIWSVELDVIKELELHQINAAYALWRQHPHRLIGFHERLHVWDNKSATWNYSVDTSAYGRFSMVLLNAAVYHRYYHTLYWRLTTAKLRETIDTLATGEDILFNCVVGYASRSAPLLLSTGGERPSSSSNQPTELVNYMGVSTMDTSHKPLITPTVVLSYRHTCLRAFANHFGPLQGAGVANALADSHIGIMNATNVPFLPLFTSNLRYVV